MEERCHPGNKTSHRTIVLCSLKLLTTILSLKYFLVFGDPSHMAAISISLSVNPLIYLVCYFFLHDTDPTQVLYYSYLLFRVDMIQTYAIGILTPLAEVFI